MFFYSSQPLVMIKKIYLYLGYIYITMNKKSFSNDWSDINQQNIVLTKRRKINKNDHKPTGTKIYNLHQFVKKCKGDVSKNYSKKRLSKPGNTLFLIYIF